VISSYKPPDFVVNTLQHTKVKCSWDEIDKERETKLTNFSKWRELNESELQQYIASSNSDDSDNEDSAFIMDKESESKKSKKAIAVRRLLLGNDEEGCSDDEKDPFFENDKSNGIDGNVIHSFVPQNDSEEVESTEIKPKKNKKGKKKLNEIKADSANVENTDENKKSLAKLEMLFDDDKQSNSQNYDMISIVKQEKLKKKGQHKKKGGKNETESEIVDNDSFKIDLVDSRFQGLFEGDAKFGIDMTSSEFKETPAIKEILKEQSKRRQVNISNNKNRINSEIEHVSKTATSGMNEIVNKLKRKLNK
jgi:hypothetical protein